MTKGPIVIIEDDKDDQEIYAEAIRSLALVNEIRFFNSPVEFLPYINETDEQPFIILSDINMPQMTGLELKKLMCDDPYLSSKGIPFVFVSTSATKASIRHAHALSVQGYFQKPQTLDGMKKMFRILFEYWELSKHINNTF